MIRRPLTQNLSELAQAAIASGTVAVTRCPTRAAAPTSGREVDGAEFTGDVKTVNTRGKQRPKWKNQLRSHIAGVTRRKTNKTST